MSRNSSEGETFFVVCLAGIALLGFGISNIFGVPFLEGIKILPNILGWAAIFGGITYFGFLKPVSPISLATLWWCFIPILDYKAGVREDDFPFQPDVAWYGTGHGQAMVFFGIIIIGYAIMYWFNRRYY